MSNNLVITIGREYGSGGREIGKKLAEKLGVKCYDRELLERAAKESGICEELFFNHDEKPTNSFLYSLVMDTYAFGHSANIEMPLNQKVFLAQFDTIKKIAKEESCVIVGRCADYVLEDFENVINVFISAPVDYRAQNISKRRDVTVGKAKEIILKTDKKRSSYYNYYTNKRWGDTRSYNLCIDSSKLGVDGCVYLLLSYIEINQKSK